MNKSISGAGKTMICVMCANMIKETAEITCEAGHMLTLEEMFQTHLSSILSITGYIWQGLWDRISQSSGKNAKNNV